MYQIKKSSVTSKGKIYIEKNKKSEKTKIDIDEKLKKLFDFLCENRGYNKILQEKYLHRLFSTDRSKKDILISLCYHATKIASQPSIDKLASLYKTLYNKKPEIKSMKSFISAFKGDNGNTDVTYNVLYDTLKMEGVFGKSSKKTSAIFVKIIYQLHNLNYCGGKYKIWDDVPTKLKSKNDRLYLPVDRVITNIFKKMSDNNWNFDSINELLYKKYKSEEIEIWDDLWFWGFITQKGSDKRDFGWNENKYWSLWETDKKRENIIKIQKKANKFLTLIGANRTQS